MILLRKKTLVRALAAVLLLCPYGVSKVVCVSPSHEAVEDSLATCCLPGSPSNPEVSKPTPCQGCTDYALDSTVEIKGPQADSAHACSRGNTVSAQAGVFLPIAMPSLAAMDHRDGQLIPLSPQSQTAVLRC